MSIKTTDQHGYPLSESDLPGPEVPLHIRHTTGPWRPPAVTPYDADALRLELEADEGRKTHPYRCPAGYLTAGIGHNLDANGLPEHIIDELFRHDVNVAEACLDHADPGWREHPDPVQRALINLVFNLGCAGWTKFKNTRAALARRDYEAAAKGLEASKWRKQVQKSRSDRIISQIENAGIDA